MRYSIPRALGLGVFSLLVLNSNGTPITRSLACVGECGKPKPIDGVDVLGLHASPPEILPRAGGKPRPGRPGSRPDDPNSPSNAGDQTGEVGGFSSPELEGGFGDTEAGPASPPASNREGPPSVKNNHLQSSTGGDPVRTDRPIDVALRKTEIQTAITKKGLDRSPWLFYSGMGVEMVNTWKPLVDRKLGQKTGYIGDVINKAGPPYMEEYQRFLAANSAWYFWGANSKAFAQAVEGKVYAVMPEEKALNQPYDDKGSNWWSYELPELTRSDKIDSVSIFVPNPMDIDDTAIGEAKLIWQRGDPPLGFPGDERYKPTRPSEPWDL